MCYWKIISGTFLQAVKSWVSIPYEVIGFFIWPNPSSHTTTPGSTQLLLEMSTRNLPDDKWRPARKAGNITAICQPIV
jgi:hypothetical protein